MYHMLLGFELISTIQQLELSLSLSAPPDIVPNKYRLQLKANIPEMNPAFDTYRIGTVLEMVRAMVLPLVYEGKKVRICVQQSLGEGVLSGMPLALSSMLPVLVRMDWQGKQLPIKEGEEGEIRFGRVGPEYVKDDDDVIIIIAPQNVVGGSLMSSLEAMIKKAEEREREGERERERGICLINPLLEDKPSSNNVMQVRGRKERREFADSFQEIYCMRLLYPSTGGYMYPIRGLLARKDVYNPYVAYSQELGGGSEKYEAIAAFPVKERKAPDISEISNLFTSNKRK
eukprot:CAMPEP_0182423374 /NCGR_PEP_ID=MMETSP1167-20130531/9351_1 /TAXON_ID=2988 /ORGANISM="Mallomonas Sp, Strain CCMP3275" /LENGTH=286 /DNA_ID=CAMNT_0024602287 /DNA_START=429 /DNA_END=1289 /DNA_ORIENTATION=+